MTPKFIGLFPSQFPGWGRDEKPVMHKSYDQKAGDYTGPEVACDMAFHQPGSSVCLSVRYNPVGVAGIDADGNCWVLARDFAIPGYGGGIGLVWVKFPVEAAK